MSIAMEEMKKFGTCPIKLQEDMWVLGNYYFNLYLIRGSNGSALVETGVSAIVDSVIDQLESLDIKPAYIVVTHPHADHVTGLDGLREKYPEAKVVVGNGAEAFLSHPKAATGLVAEDRFISHELMLRGIKPGRPPLEKPPSIEDAIVAEDGQELDLGGVSLRFLEVSGHSPGNIIVHVPQKDAVIASDSMGFHFPGRGFIPLFFTGLEAYIATIDRIERLNPQLIGLGHQGTFVGKGVSEAFARTRESVKMVVKLIDENKKTDKALLDDLFIKSYKDEFTLYTEKNIRNCSGLLIRRVREKI